MNIMSEIRLEMTETLESLDIPLKPLFFINYLTGYIQRWNEQPEHPDAKSHILAATILKRKYEIQEGM